VSHNLGEMPIEDVRELLQASRQTLTALVDSLANRPNMQNAIRRLMRLVLQVSVAVLVNVQSVEAVDREMKKRAVKGN
jgi:hypothetical protein